MSGYLSTSKSLSVTDYCWWKGYVNGVWKDYYGNWATASVTVTAGTGSTADYSVTVTTSNYNFIQIYLAIDGVVVLNSKDTGGKKTYYYSGKADIWGDDVSIRLGVGCSQYTDATMSFTEGTLTRTSWSDGSAPSLTITDNGDNTATMSGRLGSNGTNNGLYGSTLYWTTNGLQPNGGSSYTTAESMGTTSGGSYSKTINIPSNCSTIWAVTYCSFSYNSTNTGHISQSVKYYTAPGDPGKPTISYTKSRLTIKEDWKVTWDAADPTNDSSPVAFYRFRLYKKSPKDTNFRAIHIYDSKAADRTPLSKKDNEDIYLDVGNVLEYTFNPDFCGITAKDQVNISIEAFSKNGKGSPLRGGRVFKYTEGTGVTVQNAGIVRVKISNTGINTTDYKEGQVWVKISDTGDNSIDWKEAETVRTKVSNTGNADTDWKESQ